MGKYTQTVARISAGLAAFTAYTWLLWPGSWAAVKGLPIEPLVVFLPLFAAWIATEIKTSEEIIFRNSTPNDVRLAQRLIGYYREQFRILLKDHDFHSSIATRYVSEASLLGYDFRTKRAFFQNKRLVEPFAKFMNDMEIFSDYIAQHTVPSSVGGQWRTSFRNKTEILSEELYSSEAKAISKANEFADAAWVSFESFVDLMMREVPEAADATSEVIWFSSDEN
jgi:hypothetical protein